MNASSPTQPKPVASTVTARFKSTLARLIGVKPVDKSGQSEPTLTATVAETIWSKEWCAKEPALAALAIEALQDRVGILEDYIKAKEPKPRKRLLSRNPDAVLLNTLLPNTTFILLRSGEMYRTHPHGWSQQQECGTDRICNLHGASRVMPLTFPSI